jgi:uncharacterized protein with HEPN domain
MLDAIERVERYSSRGRDVFDRDELIQNWVVHHLQLLDEAARALPEDFRALAPEIEWKKMIGMRHVLVHDYFAVDRDVVWSTVERELPQLRGALAAFLQRLTRK